MAEGVERGLRFGLGVRHEENRERRKLEVIQHKMRGGRDQGNLPA